MQRHSKQKQKDSSGQPDIHSSNARNSSLLDSPEFSGIYTPAINLK
jgi:hypothetical protein